MDEAGISWLLGRLREGRGFDTSEVADAKLGRLEHFFRAQRLDAAVVGVSGGVDSALVLALLQALRTRAGSPLRRLVALSLPIEGPGASNQVLATQRGRAVAEALGVEFWAAPLGPAQAHTVAALSAASGLAFDAWAAGQCASVMRTPALYAAAALLQHHGYRSLVVGTTNRDEGAYLGFFGKASDGMVDLQPIADLHKSEVRALARLFGVPSECVDATPEGGVHDGRTDEDMIGASYDEVEAVLRLLELELEPRLAGERAAGAVAELHRANRHKYGVGSPAVYLDVMPRAVPGGAQDEVLSGRLEQRPAAGVLLGEWEPPEQEFDAVEGLPQWERLPVTEGVAIRAHGVLTQRDCRCLGDAFLAAGGEEAVGVTGVSGSSDVGSLRRTAWSPALATALWKRLRPCVPCVRFLHGASPSDGYATAARSGHRSWRVVGLSPVLRFMRYEVGGQHFGHYDAAFDYGDGRRSLSSVVFYLTSAEDSGATRFLRDGQAGSPTRERNFSDWAREAREDEVELRCYPTCGGALIFDHRLCHDVERWDGPGARLIIRADVVYGAIPDGRV